MTTITKPAYRQPWEHGAKAYAQADTLEALRQGMKRKRNMQMIHLALDGEFGSLACSCCGIALNQPYAVNKGENPTKTDTWGTGKYYPKSKKLVVMHYYCSWGALLQEIFKLGRFIQL